MTNFYYDTEFLEDGETIDLISIGMVSEYGDELYRVSSEFNTERAQDHSFLAENVLPSLPGTVIGGAIGAPGAAWWLDTQHPSVSNRREIAGDVLEFITGCLHRRPVGEPATVDLWAWYGAYDHVALMQLWGPMMAKPEPLPMYTHDMKQEYDRLGQPAGKPVQQQGEHNALHDARWNREMHDFLRSVGA